jgi:hypothetical protein
VVYFSLEVIIQIPSNTPFMSLPKASKGYLDTACGISLTVFLPRIHGALDGTTAGWE